MRVKRLRLVMYSATILVELKSKQLNLKLFYCIYKNMLK
jgi:hypothetical protein